MIASCSARVSAMLASPMAESTWCKSAELATASSSVTAENKIWSS